MKTVLEAIQFEMIPKYIRGVFQTRNTECNIQGNLLSHTLTHSSYHLLSSFLLFRYTSANMWNNLTEDLGSYMVQN